MADGEEAPAARPPAVAAFARGPMMPAAASGDAPTAPPGEGPSMLDSADHHRIPSMRHRVSAEEWRARLDLAAAYRLVALYEMSDLSANHISARVPGEDAFLINPYGMLYEEITASSLIKIDHEGNILLKPEFPGRDYGVNRAGFVIHSAIHKARHEVACVAHTHTWAGMAVPALDCGLDRKSVV